MYTQRGRSPRVNHHSPGLIASPAQKLTLPVNSIVFESAMPVIVLVTFLQNLKKQIYFHTKKYNSGNVSFASLLFNKTNS